MKKGKKITLTCMLIMQCIGIVAAEQRNPNVVFFLVDDLGSGEVGCYASKFHETPNIDALAAQGMLFTTAYSPSAVCSPSRAALLTGQSRIGYRPTGHEHTSLEGTRDIN